MIKSFKYAFEGIREVFCSELNFRIHVLSAILVIVFGLVFKVKLSEWCILLVLIGLVLSFEMVNTAIEVVCNFVSPTYHNKIKIIKDIASGAVLIQAIFAFAIACIIFIPKIIEIC